MIRRCIGQTLGAVAVGALVVLGVPTQAQAAYKIGDDKANLTIGGLVQPWAALYQSEAPNGGTQSDFYVRRMRLILSGQLNEKVNFFVETDAPNFGKAGNHEVNMFMQDAYVELNVAKPLQIDAGMLLAPFSHHGMQGAGSLLAVDYHVDMLRYPPGSNKVWRSAGVMVRGSLFKDILEYRLAVLNGVNGNNKFISRTIPATQTTGATTWQEQTDPRNRSDWPRFVARLSVNAFESEAGPGVGGMFYDGLYLKKTPRGTISPKKVLALGASFDYQKNLAVTETPITAGSTGGSRGIAKNADYYAAAADLFWDIPIGLDKIMSLNGQFNFYYYNFGDRTLKDAFYNRTDQLTAARLAYTGYGLLAEIGFRYDFIEPFFVADWYQSNKANGDLGDYLAIHGGVAGWLDGHATTLKVQAGSTKIDGKDFKASGIVQLQLLF